MVGETNRSINERRESRLRREVNHDLLSKRKGGEESKYRAESKEEDWKGNKRSDRTSARRER